MFRTRIASVAFLFGLALSCGEAEPDHECMRHEDCGPESFCSQGGVFEGALPGIGCGNDDEQLPNTCEPRPSEGQECSAVGPPCVEGLVCDPRAGTCLAL